MNFPVLEFPWLGNGTVIAIIAIIHVIVSHGVAIGATALMVSMEYVGIKNKNEDLIQLARKFSKWILIITTTVGAMTGVGIWISTTVIQPDSIGSLLRLFFIPWFVEWLVFVGEVILLLIYFYSWDKWTGEKRYLHNRIGFLLLFFGWLTAMIITGILTAKLTPGRWSEDLSFWNAFLSPPYLPSLAFRSFIAIVLAVSLVSIFIRLFVRKKQLKQEVFSLFGKIYNLSLPLLLISGLWYLVTIPDAAYQQVVWSTGMSKEMFMFINYSGLFVFVLFGIAIIGRPDKVSIILSLGIFFSSMGFIAEFEMVRESVRKPYIIYGYMYANGVLEKDEEKYKQEGYLTNSTFSRVDKITEDNVYTAGEELYQGQCMSCHTVDGWRERRAFSKRLEGWTEESIDQYIDRLHEARPFMPPFVGTDQERQALAKYLHKVTNETGENQ
ncbi:cytochrome c [Bacillus altitudinis]|uniref:cytochrome c n=1 Tax=Bacillus altitudinis TaxID=293387 RepID=UPI00107208FC|nr:cytochrome c [Bacillus altitudinis]MED1532046.1 c-type cytochrome [Bacillus altitudinis]QEO62805.1 cytochrome c [Bacillus altitudinis]